MFSSQNKQLTMEESMSEKKNYKTVAMEESFHQMVRLGSAELKISNKDFIERAITFYVKHHKEEKGSSL